MVGRQKHKAAGRYLPLDVAAGAKTAYQQQNQGSPSGAVQWPARPTGTCPVGDKFITPLFSQRCHLHPPVEAVADRVLGRHELEEQQQSLHGHPKGGRVHHAEEGI